jgi:hypothetical protein
LTPPRVFSASGTVTISSSDAIGGRECHNKVVREKNVIVFFTFSVGGEAHSA